MNKISRYNDITNKHNKICYHPFNKCVSDLLLAVHLFFQQIRPWAARNHRSGSTSLLLLVTSSVLMVKEWSAKWRDLSNHTRRGTIQSRTPEKKAKNRVTLTWKFPWKSCSTAHLSFLSSSPKILKPSLKTFPQIEAY